MFMKQIEPYVRTAELEAFAFSAFRPINWSIALDGVTLLSSAVPAPFDARFPDGVVRAPVVNVTDKPDWTIARGKWSFVQATMQGSSARNSGRVAVSYR